jgi:hypothetical protein
MDKDELENHCSWLCLNEQAHIAAMEEDELKNHFSWCHLNEQACIAAVEEDVIEDHQSWRQDSCHRLVTALQEARQSLSNNAGELMSLHMVSIPSAAQLSNHDQDLTKTLLMWHKNHYPRLHNLLDILDVEPWGAPDAPPTQTEQNLATALEELKIMPQIEDNTQKNYHSLHDQNTCTFGCCSCSMSCILPSVYQVWE